MLELEELRKRKKDEVVKLIEVADVTRQVAEAVERNDAVAAQMLLNEREQPVRALKEMEEELRAYIVEQPEAEAIRLNELMRGAEAETDEEKPLVEQVAQFRRLLASVQAMDEQLSVRMGGNQSYYKKFRK
ncbi:MAG: hypothetical protein E7422_05930 [Ruminococcaceae bacterium]|jgi:ribosomal 50S subunit-associated protein YjgA (DUF615 family)|nr:hypothetical protein [Oscillospiraceae bacterium]